MVNRPTPTQEKYNCSSKKEAYKIIYPSLQSDRTACGGSHLKEGAEEKLESLCERCEFYFINALKEDWSKLDSRISQ